MCTLSMDLKWLLTRAEEVVKRLHDALSLTDCSVGNAGAIASDMPVQGN